MKTILIIDDEDKIRDQYKRLLADEGYEVVIARDAAEGTFAMIKNGVIDLVLLDINMPGVDGGYMKEVIDIYDPAFKVIVSSVRPMDEQKEIVPGAVDYFDKAEGTEVLLRKVRKAFENV